MRKKELIFLVESDTDVSHLTCHSLESAGYDVRAFATTRVIDEAEITQPSLFLVAMMMPDRNALDFCRRVRQNPLLDGIPFVFLMNGAGEEDSVLALESGADDCIVKPFSTGELVARVQAVLRRRAHRQSPTSAQAADIVIDRVAMKLSVRGREVSLTTLEFRLVEYLALYRGRVFTRDLLLDAVWVDLQVVTPRSVDACVRRIREKIEPNPTNPIFVRTIRGVGYRMDAITAWDPESSKACDCAACTASMERRSRVRSGNSRPKRKYTTTKALPIPL